MICLSNSKCGLSRLTRLSKRGPRIFPFQTSEPEQLTSDSLHVLDLSLENCKFTPGFSFRASSTYNGNCRRTIVLPHCAGETRHPYFKLYRSRNASNLRQTHYETLGLQRDASAEDIRSAFLQKSKECHPDLNSKNSNNHAQFVLVNEAYSVLSKPMERRDYDISLNHQEVLMKSGRTSTMTNDHYYHHPRGFYDEQLYSMRDKSKDDYYKSQPYYGIRGLEKISNFNIVAACFVFMFAGIILHFFAVSRSSKSHIQNLDRRDMKAHKLLVDAKKEGEAHSSNTKEYKLDLLFQKQADILSERSK